MKNTLPSDFEKRVLELTARVIELKYLMYMPATYPHRSGLLYTKEDGRVAMWNPIIDDGDIFRLAVAVPSFDLREVILSAPQASGDSLENRCARVREAFVLSIAQRAGHTETREYENRADPKTVLEKG